MRFIELFAGIGGFRYGLERVCTEKSQQGIQGVGDSQGQPEQCTNQRSNRFTCVWANEIDKYAAQIYRKNFGEGELYEGDITKISETEIPDHDLLVGGFPDGWTEGVSDTQRYKCLGNAVTTNVIKAIGEKLF